MKNLLTVARFEWHYHRHRSATYLFAGLVFGQGCWQVVNAARYYAGTDPATLVYFALSSLGVLPAMVCVLLAGQSLTKDQEFRAGAYLYALPITSRSFFAGRFLGNAAHRADRSRLLSAGGAGGFAVSTPNGTCSVVCPDGWFYPAAAGKRVYRGQRRFFADGIAARHSGSLPVVAAGGAVFSAHRYTNGLPDQLRFVAVTRPVRRWYGSDLHRRSGHVRRG